MAALIDFSIKIGDDWHNMTIGINDESKGKNGYNVSAWKRQTPDERKAKELKQYYPGGGKVFWTDGHIALAEKQQDIPTTSATSQQSEYKDLPF